MTTREPLGTEHDELLFAVRRSVRYHRHRERFLDRAHQLGVVLVLRHDQKFGHGCSDS